MNNYKTQVNIPESFDLNKEIEYEITNENAMEILEMHSIKLTDEIIPPKVCLSIIEGGENASICTLGNYSMLIGKAKSRKTFCTTLALATATKNGIIQNKFIGNLPDNKRMVLYFDTEQGKHHVQKAFKRISLIADVKHPSNIKVYSLRSESTLNRLKLIEKAVYRTKDLGFVVIDGIRDLVTSINDEEQATFIANKLLKWTEELDIHIICVLHQNKGDNNARGHLGTELQNKAETVLSVTKYQNDENISIVSAEYCRDKEPKDFAFTIDSEGLPYTIEGFEVRNEATKRKAIIPSEIDELVHKDILKKVFNHGEKFNYKDLVSQVKFAYNEYGKSIGDNKAKEFVTYYKNKLFIKFEGFEGTKSCYYLLNN